MESYLNYKSQDIPASKEASSRAEHSFHDLQMTNDEKATIFGLCHLALRSTDRIKTLMLLAAFHLKHYKTIHIITSSYQSSEAATTLRAAHFSQSPDDASMWQHNTIRVSLVQETALFATIKNMPQLEVVETTPDAGRSQRKHLVIFDAVSFSAQFMDHVCPFIDQLTLISSGEIDDVIEVYQVMKSYRALNQKLNVDYFLVTDKDDSSYRLIRERIQSLGERYLHACINLSHVFPKNFFSACALPDVAHAECAQDIIFQDEFGTREAATERHTSFACAVRKYLSSGRC